MASAPIPSPHQEEDLSRDDWWKLFDEVRLAQQNAYAEYGGPVAFFRKERETDAEPSSC